MRISELLDQAQAAVPAIDIECSVEEAIDRLTENGVGALIVMAGEMPAGIFAERDVLRCYCRNRSRAFAEVRIHDVMTNKLIVAEPEEEIETAIAAMIRADIRHLPVIADRRIIGMLTLIDLVKHSMGAMKAELHYLQDYISDLHDASRD